MGVGFAQSEFAAHCTHPSVGLHAFAQGVPPMAHALPPGFPLLSLPPQETANSTPNAAIAEMALNQGDRRDSMEVM
jgi:hypothetical protein